MGLMFRQTRLSSLVAQRIAAVALAIAILIVSSACNSNKGVSMAVATPTSTTNVKDSVESFRGKVVILDFWATWCGPCRSEIPDFIALQNEYQDDGLEIVGVSIDPIAPRGQGGPNVVHNFVKQNKINYTILLVENHAAMAGYDVSQGIPTTYVIDRDGRIVKTYIGAQPRSRFEQDIKRLL